MLIVRALCAGVTAALLLPVSANATDGYFSHGYGIKAQGIAGVGIAFPQDSLAAATNPAGTAFVGDRLDLGISWFLPDRGAEIVGNAFGPDQSYDGNGKENFFIPDIGYVKQVSEKTAIGIAIYGNGGLNTQYNTNPYQRFSPTPLGAAGVDLAQLFVSPSVAYKLNENNALGIALNFAYQRFSATGLSPFANASVNPGAFTNQGNDSSTGWGVRIGWTGQLTPELTLGATYASKTSMGKLNKYSGLFADGGGFDIPANFGIGVAYKASPKLTLAGDVKQIQYSHVASVGNPLDNLFAGNAFGSPDGPGFGWRDVTVIKLGVSYDYSEALTLRGGYSWGSQPIPESQTFLNILAPGVVQQHLTLGATWKFHNAGELSVAYTHAFQNTVNGSGSIPTSFGGGNANIHLEENILGVAYGWKL